MVRRALGKPLFISKNWLGGMAVSHEGEGDICSGLELDTEMLVPELELLIEIELQREDNWPQ